MTRPLCFVLMPFGKKKDAAGGPDIDFDRVYAQAIEPAVRDAELDPIRADEERAGGVIHKAMFERLLLCDFAVADLTTANANVLYELGVRHATRPRTTVPIFAKGQPLPFDVNFLRALPYALGDRNAFADAEAGALRAALANKLRELRSLAHEQAATDSPLYELLQGYPTIDLPHLRSEAATFRARVEQADALRARTRQARQLGLDGKSAEAASALAAIEAELAGGEAELGVWIELYLAYRAIDRFDEMRALFEKMPVELRHTTMIREQLAFAENRAGEQRGDDGLRAQALERLEKIRAEIGANPETCGLIGRIHKRSWRRALDGNRASEARGHLRKAIASYVEGFEADWRDAYPGVNALTLLAAEGGDASLATLARLLPVVRFSVEQRLRGRTADYWDHATLLELAVHANDEAAARAKLDDALAAKTDLFQPKTTADNLAIIRDARRARGAAQAWLDELIAALTG